MNLANLGYIGSILLLFLATFNTYADAQFTTLKTLPPDIQEKIRAAPLNELYTVEGRQVYEGDILKVNTLVFHGDYANLVMNTIDVPYLVIVAKNLKVTDVDGYYQISRRPLNSSEIAALKGHSPGQAALGNPSYNRGGGHSGRDGGTGSIGAHGGTGKTKSAPNIFFVAENIEAQSGHVSQLSLKFLFNGFDGGQGGTGGTGGKGGNGEKGRKAETKWVEALGSRTAVGCDRGPGRGGRGGTGGQGGNGGKAGAGGTGSDIYLAAPPAFLDILSYASITNNGGLSGLAGMPGAGGNPGLGGHEGSTATHCNSAGREGYDGAKGMDGAAGLKSTSGQRGKAYLIPLLEGSIL